jgi:hypothetical protein
MKKKAESEGLCLNCKNDDDCTYPKNYGEPVVHCEEFACEGSNKPERNVKQDKKSPVKSNDPDIKGLCSNCEKVNDCKSPKPEGGVWHCEEYR